MPSDILQQSWVYQAIKQEGVVEGLAKGRAEGRAEGQEKERQMWLESQREALVNAVKARFPDLLPLAWQKASSANDPLVLQDAIVKLFVTQSLEEAQAILDANT